MIAAFLALTLSAQMSDAHRKWLEEEVVYIITEREKEAFESLATVEERNLFIEAFWARRDPNPGTPANEFKDEHYRRIEHANKFLGRETYRPGWRTDRGRFYIILGEPRETQRFTGYNELVDSELWFYQGEEGKGLPSFFYLLFFQRDGVGEYQLYSPTIDGPPGLLRGTQFLGGADNLQAIDALEQISTELAHASLSFDTGEPPDYLTGRAAMGAEAVIARIEDSPRRAIRTEYVDAWLQYGNRVSAEYSFNFVPNRNAFAVMVGEDATAIVHYSIELDPSSFGLATDEDQEKYYTTLDITVEATNTEGKLVFVNDRSDYIELASHQVKQIETFPFAYQNDFPLIPGSFTVSVILRNRVLKRYTVAEQKLEVPDFAKGGPQLVGVILAHKSERTTAPVGEAEVRTFQLGSLRVEPSTEGLFSIGDTIHAFVQAYGASGDHRVRFELAADGDPIEWREVDVEKGSGAALAELATLGTAGGNYVVRAKLLDSSSRVVHEREASLVLSPRTSIARPNFVYRRGFNTTVPGLLPLVRGDQHLSAGNLEAAFADFRKAVEAGNPQLPQARWKLAWALLRGERADDALSLLLPLEAPFPQQYEVVAGIGLAHYLKGDDARSVGYLEKAIGLRPPETSLLNALGEAYERLGNPEKARTYYERSLELDSGQEQVRTRLAALSGQ